MHVILKLGSDGRVKDLELEGTDTIAEVRLKVAAVTGVHPEHQRLVLMEGDVELLDNTKTVAQHHIRKEAEIRLIARPAPRVISLNVGGSYHSTLLSTLRTVEGSRLDKMFDGLAPIEHVASAEGLPHEVSTVFIPRQADGAYFIDRDGRLFEYVIDYLRDYNSAQAQAGPEPEPEGEPAEDVAPAEISLPSSPDDLRQLAEHAGFYGLPGLTAACRHSLAEQERGPFFASTSTRLFETAVPCGPRHGRNAENLPLHLVTRIRLGEDGSNLMWHLRFQGFDYMSSAPYDIVAVGYQYGQYGLRNNGVSYSGSQEPHTVRLEQYSTGDGFLAFKLTKQTEGNWHASSLVVDFVGAPNGYLQRGLAALKPEGGTFQWVGHAPAEAKLVVEGAGMDALNGYYKESGIVDHGRPRYAKVDTGSAGGCFSWQKLNPPRPNDWRISLGNSVYISYGDADKPPTDGWQETGHMPDQVTAPVPRIVWL